MSSDSIAELERAAADSWRAPDEEQLGGWRLRAADGFTGRANSALPLGDPGVPLIDAAGAIRAWYGARGLRPIIAVPFALAGPQGSEVDRFLDAAGWPLRDGPAVVMTADARVSGPAGGPEIVLSDEPGDDWLALYHYRGQELPPIARRLLLSAPWQQFGRVREGGQTVAIGRVAQGGAGWAGLTAIETSPAHRRRGLASAVTAGLVRAAAARGLDRIFLQVEHGNDAARALYARLGFTPHHRYHYRLAPE